jgi:excinuclease ABC subunit C
VYENQEVREPVLIPIAQPSDPMWESIPDRPAVFLLRAGDGAPYLARTAFLRRRLKRLFSNHERISKMLNLRGMVEQVEYWPTGSQLDSMLLYVELARKHFPDDWQKITRLKPCAYLRLTLDNPFPRTLVTTRLGRGFFFGPFPNRTGAERFEQEMLDLFQLRRCEDNLEPTPQHPGCIYGEMNKCLRPCQAVVGTAEYRSEAQRVEQFLRTAGASLREPTESARDRASAELQFEEAAQMHERVERIVKAQSLAGDLARAVDQLAGVAVLPSFEAGVVELWFMLGGAWLEPHRVETSLAQGSGGSLDRTFRELTSTLKPHGGPRNEHLSILMRWYGSSWRDGEWIGFDSLEKIPYRRLVNAVSRVSKQPV